MRQTLRLERAVLLSIAKSKSTNGNTNDRQDEKQPQVVQIALQVIISYLPSP